MNFDKSILHSFQSWKLNNATLNNGVITIKPNGSIQCVVYPRDKDESKIRESYQVIVTQGGIKGKLSFTFDNHLTEHENLKLTSIVIYSESNINKILKTETNVTERTVVIIENLSENDIEITNVELKPLSNIPIDIELELNKYTTHIFKYSNPDVVVVNQEKNLIANLNVELQETSNLILQVLINGASTSNSTLTLDITINTKDLEYSPITLDIGEGTFLVGIPGNIMNASEGENVVKIYATTSNGEINIDTNKIQVTLSGQNMMVIYGEDIWFGPSYDNSFDPCENEVFTYDSDILFIQDGKLQVKCIENYTTDMSLKSSLRYGNVYGFAFDVTKVRKYENVIISSFTLYQLKKSSGVVISGTVLGVLSTLAVGAGITLNNNDDIYDIGRLFYDYVERNHELTWDVVKITFDSAKALNDTVLINSGILDICKGFFDDTFKDRIVDVKFPLGCSVPYIENYDDILPYVSKHYDITADTIKSCSDFSVGGIDFIYKNYTSNYYYYDMSLNGKVLYNCSFYEGIISTYDRLTIACGPLSPSSSTCFIGLVAYNYRTNKMTFPSYVSYGNSSQMFKALGGVGTLPYNGGYDWGQVEDKIEGTGDLPLPIPGYLDNLVGKNPSDVWDKNFENGLVGDGDLYLPSVDNPSIDIDDNISFPPCDNGGNPDIPPLLFDAYLYEYEGKYYTESEKGELIETTTHELTDDLFLNEGVYSINSDLIEPNMKVLYYKVENKDVVPQVKYSGVYEGATITMDWDLQSEQGKTFNVLGDVYSDDNVRFLLSNNKGQSWLTFNGYEVVSCDINNIKDNGMTYDVFTSLIPSQLQSFKGGTNSLRIAIYIEQYSVNGKTNIDHIRLRY